MLKKRTMALTVVVVFITAFSTAKQSILSTTKDDLFFNERFYDADKLNDPVPGKAYAFFRPESEFKKTAICSFRDGEMHPDIHERFRGINVAGVGYNQAIGVVTDAIGEKLTKVLFAGTAEQEWPVIKRHNARSGGVFVESCIDEVTAHVEDPEFDVFIIDTVYLDREGSNKPFMVKFKPRPFVFTVCDNACALRRSTLLTLLRPSALTRLKQGLIDIDRI